MSVAAQPLFAFDNTFVRELDELYEPWQAASAPAPELLLLNDALARELGADPGALSSPDGVAVLVGNAVPAGAQPVAQAYAGHQFGGYSPRLGDGRALLLGEVLDGDGRRHDIHLKGSGRTPFARGGDGKAVVGPMLREYVVSEAMHALGIPTARALAVVATGEQVMREAPLPGAVLARVAASHLRVGTFEYAAALRDVELLRRLADHAIARHHPAAAAAADNPYLALYQAVVDGQADLVARWLAVGFVHGVMNTDNMAISGQTIDYGPCAFMDAYDPATVFSSIDHGGRYAYGNQPAIAHWNLARLGESLLPLVAADQRQALPQAVAVLDTFPARFQARRRAHFGAKLGLADAGPDDDGLLDRLLQLMHAQEVDFTRLFRALSTALEPAGSGAARALFADDPGAFDAWADDWRGRVLGPGRDPAAVGADMDRVNPVYVPRNHLVEDALARGTFGDLAPLHALLEALAHPFDERPGLEAYALPAPTDFGEYRTFCGT